VCMSWECHTGQTRRSRQSEPQGVRRTVLERDRGRVLRALRDGRPVALDDLVAAEDAARALLVDYMEGVFAGEGDSDARSTMRPLTVRQANAQAPLKDDLGGCVCVDIGIVCRACFLVSSSARRQPAAAPVPRRPWFK
jgi:hypothetical protein